MSRPLLIKVLLVVLLKLTFQTALSAQLVEKKIQASFDKKLLELALLELELHHQLNFIYDEKDITNLRISASIPKLPLEDGLKILLTDTDLSFKLQEPNKIILFPRDHNLQNQEALQPSLLKAQNFDLTVSGIIKDATNGENLPFTTIQVKGTTNGTTTNVDGWFSLFNVPADTSILEVSYIGYQTTYFRLQPNQSLDGLTIKLQPSSQVLTEITVKANRQEQMIKASTGISQVAINPAQLTAVPSLGEKDIFRSLQLLPGVSGSNESSSGLFVRGGTPDQNLVLFDGFTVYHVDHLFGFFSAFNSQAIKDVQLYKGGFAAKYGGRLSSVVDITGKDGNSEQFNIGSGLSPLSANLFSEIPFADGRGSILLTGRRSFSSSFYDNLLEFSDGDGETGTEENTEEEEPTGPFGGGRRGFADTEPVSWFYDLNAKITYQSNKDIFSFSFYNGQDRLDNSRYSDQNSFGAGLFGGGSADFNFMMDVIDKSDWGNTGSSLKWSRRWNDKLYSNALLSYSNYFSYRDRGVNSIIERDTTTTEINNLTVEDNDLIDYSLRWDWEWQPNQLHNIGFGLFGSALDIKYDYIQNDTTTVLARDDQGIVAGAYLQSKTTINNKLIISPGIRLSYFDQTQQTYFEPRLQLQYLASNQLKFKAATGRFYQFANRIIREDISQGSRDFWILSDDNRVPVGRSDHLILGVAYETKDYLFDIEAYYKDLDNLTEYSTRFVINGFGPNNSLDFEENFFNGTGVAKGVELLAQKKTGLLTGWISYTLGRVENTFDVFGDAPFPASHDVRHELKIVAAYQAGKWTFGGTFIYASGKPYTAPLGAYSVELLDGNYQDFFAVSDKNAFRLPSYHRLDVSINHDMDNFFGGKASAGLSLFNLYNRKNIWYKEYEVVDGIVLETNVNLLDFTPSLYFNWSLN